MEFAERPAREATMEEERQAARDARYAAREDDRPDGKYPARLRAAAYRPACGVSPTSGLGGGAGRRALRAPPAPYGRWRQSDVRRVKVELAKLGYQLLRGGRVVQRHVLYLGEINDTQELAWRRSIAVLEEGAAQPRTLSLFPGPL
jgi:hypothetical protein